MGETKYFVVNKKAVPEVLLKVVEAKRLLETGKVLTVQEATVFSSISSALAVNSDLVRLSKPTPITSILKVKHTFP